MKTIFARLFTAAALSAVLFAACQKPEEEMQPAEPNFPAETFSEFLYPESEADLSSDDEMENEYEIVFTPNYSWTLSIPTQEAASYFRLRNGSQDVFTIRGNASETPVTIPVYCRAGSRDFENHTVEVSLTMDGRTEVIGTVTMPSLLRTFEVYPVKTDADGFVEAPEGSSLQYQYETAALSSDTPVELVWNSIESMYEGYVLVDANSDWTPNISSTSAEITVVSGNKSGTQTEVHITCNIASSQEQNYELVLDLTDEDVPAEEKTHTYGVHVPVFETSFGVYPVEENADGDFVPGDSDEGTFRMSYSETPLEPESAIELQYVSESGRFMTYILVDSNFGYTDISATIDDDGTKPDWLEGIVPDWLDVEELTVSGTKKEYRLTVAPQNSSLEGDTQPLSFDFSEIGYSYDIILPACKDLFEVALSFAGTADFDYKGLYYNTQMGQYVEDGASIGITSASGLKVYELVKNERDFYVMDRNDNYTDAETAQTDWIHTEYSWNSADPGIIQTNSLVINVDPNDGGIREGVVIALPAGKAEEALKAAEGLGGDLSLIFSEDGFNIAEAYEDYVVSYISQAANPTSAGIIIEEETNWEALGGTFGELDSSDPLAGYAAYEYQITYTWNEWKLHEGTTTFGRELPFKVNLTYTDYDVYSVNSYGDPDPVADKDNFWIKLVKTSDDGSHYISITPEDLDNIAGGEAYFMLKNGESAVALIKFSYDIDGEALDLELSQGEDCTLVQLTGDDVPEGAGAAPCWLLTYTGSAEGALAMISGLPEGVDYIQGSAPWAVAESLGGGMISVDILPSEAEEGDTETYIQFGVSQPTFSYVLYLIVRMEITE